MGLLRKGAIVLGRVRSGVIKATSYSYKKGNGWGNQGKELQC